MKIVLNSIACVIIMLLLISCSENVGDTRSIEQIYKDEGVPVRIMTVQSGSFKVERSYNAVLTGIEESSAYAKVRDKVEKIYVKVGDYVEKDKILLTFPTDNLDARYFQAKVGYDNAKLAYDRIANMYQTGGISKQQLDNAKANLDVAEANWDAAQQTVIVKAPISGYVTRVNARETDNVKKEAELFRISRMNRMKARVWVSEKDVLEVERGLPAYALWNNKRIDGKVVEVDMALDPKTQAFGAIIEFNNPSMILKFGITVDVYIETYTKSDAIVVELKDLIKENDHYYVYTIENDKAVKKSVVIGKQYKMEMEIVKGLTAEEKLVVEGQMLLEDQAKVRTIE